MKTSGGPHTNKDVFHYLEACCWLVAGRYDHKPVASWSNLDYMKLSGVIYRQTNVQISASTLKRVFGKFRTGERYYPQQATRDALARFTGFADWEAFVRYQDEQPRTAHSPEPSSNLIEVHPVSEATAQPASSRSARRWLVLVGLALVALVSGWFLLPTKKAEQLPDLRGVQLLCSNPTGKAPHSAIFSLQVPREFKGPLDQFTMVFDDGKRKLPFTGGKLLHYYEIPGRYYAVLQYDGKPVDTAVVYLATNNWEVVTEMERDTMRVYPVAALHTPSPEGLGVTTQALQQSGIDTNHTFYVHFSRMQPFDIDGDNFELTARVRTSVDRPGVRCSQVKMELYGDRSKHRVLFLKPGCISWSNLRLSDVEMDGSRDDLSFLGADLSTGGVIRLRIEKKKAQLWLDSQSVYTGGYTFPLQRLYGLRISFAGIGYIDSVGIRDLASGGVYQEALRLSQ
ncbi:hypothetical protein [Paraflavitalea pollutisoli]|uniref:hypothetical protein n=1 Tax=Paraflavitalea pollutisoli TaxID=3034143 RepID=UPI0023EB2CC7|nr:hypothetical protein [Paraflavitalea sp. H1-2-19X]